MQSSNKPNRRLFQWKNSNSADLGPKKSIFAGKIVASKENQRINPCVVDHNWGYTSAKFQPKEPTGIGKKNILYKVDWL